MNTIVAAHTEDKTSQSDSEVNLSPERARKDQYSKSKPSKSDSIKSNKRCSLEDNGKKSQAPRSQPKNSQGVNKVEEGSSTTRQSCLQGENPKKEDQECSSHGDGCVLGAELRGNSPSSNTNISDASSSSAKHNEVYAESTEIGGACAKSQPEAKYASNEQCGSANRPLNSVVSHHGDKQELKQKIRSLERKYRDVVVDLEIIKRVSQQKLEEKSSLMEELRSTGDDLRVLDHNESLSQLSQSSFSSNTASLSNQGGNDSKEQQATAAESVISEEASREAPNQDGTNKVGEAAPADAVDQVPQPKSSYPSLLRTAMSNLRIARSQDNMDGERRQSVCAWQMANTSGAAPSPHPVVQPAHPVNPIMPVPPQGFNHHAPTQPWPRPRQGGFYQYRRPVDSSDMALGQVLVARNSQIQQQPDRTPLEGLHPGNTYPQVFPPIRETGGIYSSNMYASHLSMVGGSQRQATTFAHLPPLNQRSSMVQMQAPVANYMPNYLTHMTPGQGQMQVGGMVGANVTDTGAKKTKVTKKKSKKKSRY